MFLSEHKSIHQYSYILTLAVCLYVLVCVFSRFSCQSFGVFKICTMGSTSVFTLERLTCFIAWDYLCNKVLADSEEFGLLAYPCTYMEDRRNSPWQIWRASQEVLSLIRVFQVKYEHSKISTHIFKPTHCHVSQWKGWQNLAHFQLTLITLHYFSLC